MIKIYGKPIVKQKSLMSFKICSSLDNHLPKSVGHHASQITGLLRMIAFRANQPSSLSTTNVALSCHTS